jgi:hypothetical protein
MTRKAKGALIFVAVAAIIAGAQSPSDGPEGSQTQVRGYWIDSSTGLMWAAKDNGRDVSWKKAIKYCRDSRLAGYSDWRLAKTVELQGIYDKNAEAPGLAGSRKDLRPFSWHVKGYLLLTGDQWSSEWIPDDRGKPSGYETYFNFNEGRPNDDPSGWPYSSTGMRALCVRVSGK